MIHSSKQGSLCMNRLSMATGLTAAAMTAVIAGGCGAQTEKPQPGVAYCEETGVDYNRVTTPEIARVAAAAEALGTLADRYGVAQDSQAYRGVSGEAATEAALLGDAERLTVCITFDEGLTDTEHSQPAIDTVTVTDPAANPGATPSPTSGN
jgi:hypothetical protein